MGFIDFTNGEVLTADQMDLVMRQGIMRFADATARDTALSEVLAEGMMAYLDDTDEVLKYDGTDWIDISGDITGVTAGTALTGGGTSGDVTLDVDESALTIAQSQVTDLVSDLADKQDDVITTQGDLVIGAASGDAVRLPVGAADTVLTSDGTTLSFAAAGGGGENFFGLPFDKLSIINVDFAPNNIVRFAIVTTSTDPFLLNLFDPSDNLVDTVTVDRDNPFTYFTNAIAVAKIGIFQDVVNEEPVLVFSDATDVSVPPTSVGNVTTITTTQSVTLATDHIAFCFGAGGGGGGVNSKFRGAGGGGAAGFVSSGTVAAGTYTATIGAAGSGGTGDGTTGGTTSIDTVSASGGSGGSQAPASTEGGNGGNGGSGGGGGASGINDAFPGSGAAGGRNGADGTDGIGTGTPGLKGTGSGDVNPAQAQIVQPAGNSGGEGFSFITSSVEGSGAGFYAAGCGGTLIDGGRPSASAVGFAGGGNGAVGTTKTGIVTETGGNGKAGFIILVEA